MKHQAAYSLLWLSGKSDITQKDVEAFMKACGVSCEPAELEAFFKESDTVKDATLRGGRAGNGDLFSVMRDTVAQVN